MNGWIMCFFSILTIYCHTRVMHSYRIKHSPSHLSVCPKIPLAGSLEALSTLDGASSAAQLVLDLFVKVDENTVGRLLSK